MEGERPARCYLTDNELPAGEYRLITYKSYSFAVYSDGQIYSLWRRRFLKPSLQRDGYLVVTIIDHRVRVNRLVLIVFHRRPKNGEISRHLDGDQLNNDKGNLKWGTHEENWEDRKRHNRINAGKAADEKMVLKIRKRYMGIKFECYAVLQTLATEFPVSRQSIANILKLKTWNYSNLIPLGYKYAPRECYNNDR